MAAERQQENTKVPVIEDFLEKWKQNAFQWYINRAGKYGELLTQQVNESKELETKQGTMDRKEYGKLSSELYKKHSKEKNRFEKLTQEITGYRGKIDTEKLDKVLESEKKAKRAGLVERVRSITGDFKNANLLRIGENGELNGIITGIKGTAKVETISAGGWNIQCFHFRVLVKEI